MTSPTRSYERVAWCYEPLARGWSLGAIPASRLRNVETIAPGESVLFAGVGPGGDAVAAARRGARVTAADPSAAMRRRFRRKLAREKLEACIVADDVRAVAGGFDVVVAHYFLNLFSHAELPEMVSALATRLRPGGRLLIADFAPARGAPWQRALAWAHFAPVCVGGATIGLCALHPLTDYAPFLAAEGLAVQRRWPVRWSRFGPPWYEAIEAHAPR